MKQENIGGISLQHFFKKIRVQSLNILHLPNKALSGGKNTLLTIKKYYYEYANNHNSHLHIVNCFSCCSL